MCNAVPKRCQFRDRIFGRLNFGQNFFGHDLMPSQFFYAPEAFLEELVQRRIVISIVVAQLVDETICQKLNRSEV